MTTLQFLSRQYPRPSDGYICIESNNEIDLGLSFAATALFTRSSKSTFVSHFCWRVPRHKESGVSGGSGEVPCWLIKACIAAAFNIFSYPAILSTESEDSVRSINPVRNSSQHRPFRDGVGLLAVDAKGERSYL